MTPDRCLSAVELVDAIHDAASADAQRHLLDCRICAERVTLLRRIESSGVEQIAEVADEVDSLAARLLVTPRDKWWRVARQADYQRPDVVRRLLALADDASLRDRKLAVALLMVATAIVDGLSRETAGIADLRFETWKFASVLLREAGKYEDTEAALARAGDAARMSSNPRLGEASVLFARALLFAEPDVWRPDEAAALLDRAEQVFESVDAARRQAVRTARAFLLYRWGDFHSARAAFADILATTPATNGEEYLRALNNLMFARVDLGEADEKVQESVALLINENRLAGRTVPLAHARWLMGKVRRLRHDYDEAAELLRSAMAEIGDSDSAIRVGLDLLETLLLAERYAEAAVLARELSAEAVALDRREPTRRRSLTAAVFAYAREASQRGALTADLVSELSRYVDRIHRQRPTDFIPPMPLADM